MPSRADVSGTEVRLGQTLTNACNKNKIVGALLIDIRRINCNYDAKKQPRVKPDHMCAWLGPHFMCRLFKHSVSA